MTTPRAAASQTMPRVFIASSTEQKTVAEQVASLLRGSGLEPVCWFDSSAFPAGDHAFEALEYLNATVQAAVVVFGADDQTWYREQLGGTPRDNAVLEYGLFVGTHGRARTLGICVGETRLPSDLDGITYATWDPNDPKTHVSKVDEWAKGLLRPTRRSTAVFDVCGDWTMQWEMPDGRKEDEVLHIRNQKGRELKGTRTFDGRSYMLTGYFTGDRIALASAASETDSINAVSLFLEVWSSDQVRGKENFRNAGQVVSLDVSFSRRR